MKTIKLFTLLSMLSILMLACSNGIFNDEDNENENSSSSGSSSNKLKTGQVEMKGYPNSSNIISFDVTAKKITID
jgi:hypothetical protein